IANKIAAGEVVERPASVVKELVENAIDAESTGITVEIRAGGKRLIRVSDNGTGMSREDALIALERHATSKVATIEDLQQIQTLGFRGEALPSIASVSQFELLTRTADALEGTKITVEGGVVRSVQESGCSPGTHITVNNLFYNVPARLKFLKSEATEVNHITNQVTWSALAHPKVQFSLSHNARSLIDVRACDSYIERIRLLYGKEFAENLIEFDADLPNLRLHCFVGKPDFTKTNRNYQLFFLNRRPIRSKILGAALGEAMRSMVPKDRYAVAFLFLTMNAQDVDVNVHPAKIEVRFQNERAVYSEVVRLLHSGIYKSKYIPKMGRRQEPLETPGGATSTEMVDGEDEAVDETEVPPVHTATLQAGRGTGRTAGMFAAQPPGTRPVGQIARRQREGGGGSAELASHTPQPELMPDETAIDARHGASLHIQPPRRPIPAGVSLKLLDFEEVHLKTNLFNTYIVAEGKERVFFIDQHVAAERVLYERFVQQLKAEGIPVQGLLLPVTIEATSQQLTTFNVQRDLFKKLGFDVERFGGNTILVRSIPATLPTRLVAMTVTDLLDELAQATPPFPPKNWGGIEGGADLLEVEEQALITLACKSAVKAGDSLTMEEMVNLITELSQAKLPFNCPHARPIIVEMSQSELESRFKRR
ncbi:DNA mismatch repair endonuclease MutL, partial [Candidatus Poribacteria bacterium]|nr:DNA mismatch repair endonuclease MutL [Candidatus Poribacteria bacterium]